MQPQEPTSYGLNIELLAPAVDDARLAVFEAQIKCALPDDYRAFMMRYNGGRPKPSIVDFTLRDGSQSNAVVEGLLAIDSKIWNIEVTWRTLRSRVPSETLPIGTDSFGNKFLLGITGEPRGKVFFWDHELETEDGDWSNVDLIADSFDSFMRLLHS